MKDVTQNEIAHATRESVGVAEFLRNESQPEHEAVGDYSVELA